MKSEADILLALAFYFLINSLLAISGVMATLPEMHRVAVDVEHWVTDRQFADMFAIAQIAPGPNVLIVTLIGYHAAGVAGGVVATLAMCGPTAILAYVVDRGLSRARTATWPGLVRAALVPVAIALMLSTIVVVGMATAHSQAAFALLAASTVLATATKIHPLWLLAVGGAIGFFGLI